MVKDITVSPPMTLNRTDWDKILRDMLFFFLVPLTFWITAIMGTIQQPEHVISLTDFVPTNNTIIAIVSWLLSQILNAIRKYIA